jgi:hypothetical protein
MTTQLAAHRRNVVRIHVSLFTTTTVIIHLEKSTGSRENNPLHFSRLIYRIRFMILRRAWRTVGQEAEHN